jgi:branched-chain amino acid aminotransferase
MPGRSAYLNGQFVPEAEARVSIFDSGVMYGDMVFEMTRTFHQQPFRLREHLERLQGSLRFLEIDCGLSLDELERLTLETLARNLPTEASDVDWHIRHDISRGPLELYACALPEGERPTIVMSCWPLIKHLGRFAANYEHGVQVIVSPQRALPATLIDPRAKTRSRAHFQLAALHARRQGAAVWPVLADPDGYLAEGPSWNIFLVKDGVLLSPTPRSILHGVSRSITLDAAARLGIPVRETDLDREAGLQADEVFCTATSFGLVHAASFEGRTLGTGGPGPIYQRLFAAWKEVVGLDFVAQARSYAPRVAAWEAAERSASRQSLTEPR